MADKRTIGHAYNIDLLNVVFAASSILLLVSVLWMVWDDYDREWKNYQRRFVQLETEVTRLSLEAANADVDATVLEQLRADRARAEEELATQEGQVAPLEDELADLDARLTLATQRAQFAKATYDVDKYTFEVNREGDSESYVAREAEIEVQYGEWLELGLGVEQLTAERDGLRNQIAEVGRVVTDLDDQIRALTTETSRLEQRLVDLAPSLVDDYFLNAPLIDFMAPTIRVQQVITPNILDDLNFTRVPKMDRCMTCHLAINREGYEEYPQPFTTHPNLDVYVGSASPHPFETTGCTVCHEGMPQSISFQDVSHTPVSEQQEHEWVESYDWKESHLWDYPMLPTGMAEASCAKCHVEEVYVPEADVLNLAYGLYERAGCYACHKSSGFEGLRKPGPNLTRIEAKLTPEWVADWIRDPRAVKPTTWMPRVWYNSNTSSAEDAQRNEVEIDAVVAYLFANSEEHSYAVPAPPRGDSANGQVLVESVGCLACHVTGGETREEAGPRRTFGQALQNIGSKTSYEWVFDWVRNPQHYSEGTFMPNLRLTDREAADVAAYLLTLDGGQPRSAEATYDQAFADSVLLDYLKAVVPTAEAEATVAGMSGEERTLELGERVISRYGCFSCHDIAGFEEVQPVGIELSEEGTKLLTQLDFAFVDIPHTKIDWFENKLKDPRVYDQNRVLQPLEKLRMPNYDFSSEEVHLLTTAIMSFQRDVQPTAALVQGSARQDGLRVGRALVRRRNCVACHQIENDGGDYQALVTDPSLAPPLLTPEGAKVKPDWLYAFFKGPITIRPWLDVRMPTFDLEDEHWNQVLDYFGAISETIGEFRPHSVVSSRRGSVATGGELFDLLRCQQCHVLDEIPADQPTENLAPDLRMTPERLQADWIIDWIRDPQSIQPGTRMPAFWPDYPEAFYTQFDRNADQQIRSIRDHLLTFSGGPRPVEPVVEVGDEP